jgi:hypothetical protein
MPNTTRSFTVVIDDNPVDLRDYYGAVAQQTLQLLWRRQWLLVGFLLAGPIMGAAVLVQLEPHYSSEALVQSDLVSEMVGAAFYVAPNGSDSNPGTFGAPFATLARAQSAMRRSHVKTTYIRGGTYYPTAVRLRGSDTVALHLTSSDSGETWAFYQADGVASAVIDGRSGNATTGIQWGIYVDGASNVTINGLQLQHFVNEFLHTGGGSRRTTFVNNIVHDNYNPVDTGGLAAFGSVKNTIIANNYVYNVVSHGIILQACGETCANSGITGGIIRNNLIYNSCAISTDCGAIYLQDWGTPRSTDIRIENNFIRDVTAASDGGGGRGIYLDDGTSNVTVTGNIVAGNKNTCFNIHAGSHDVFLGNICDKQSSDLEAILRYETSDIATMGQGNAFTSNIVIAGSVGGGQGYLGDGVRNAPMMTKNNAYYNYVGLTIDSNGSGGAGSDINPVYVNPQISGWLYTVSLESPVYLPPVNFPRITGHWGPVGLELPRKGTPPSSPREVDGTTPNSTGHGAQP